LQPKTNTTLKDTSPDEREIVALLQNRATQERGFRLLLQAYQERLYWHIRAMVSAHEAADEVLQNTLVKVFRGIGAFRSDAKLYTWLYKIATNECLTYLAKEKRYQQRHSFDDNEQANLSNAEPYLDSQYTAQLLQKAINTLPDKQKIVFNLRYFQEMPYEEMSQMLTTSVGALKASYHHAVKKVELFLRGQSL
jgi:RNA polymerase sigma factor (sigma-70 family)